MKFLVVVILSIVAYSVEARTITFRNPCNNEVFVATRYEKSGGSDGLMESGSWRIDVTQGWWKIPQHGEVKIEVGEEAYALVISNGQIVNAVQEDGERSVKVFCYSKEGFKHEIWTRGRNNGHQIDPEGDCKRAGGMTAPFESLRSKTRGEYGTYVVSCGNPPPAPTLLNWEGGNRAYRFNPAEGKWDEFDLQSNARINQFDEKGRDKAGVVILYDPSRSMTVILNSKAALFRYDGNGTNFTKFLEGSWSQ